MAVVSCQWDACFADAEHWANGAIELFPRDAKLLLARGSVREELATLGWPGATAMIELPDPAAADASIRREWFERRTRTSLTRSRSRPVSARRG